MADEKPIPVTCPATCFYIGYEHDTAKQSKRHFWFDFNKAAWKYYFKIYQATTASL